MGLVNCPDCGKQISSVAKTCPDCGRPKGSGWTQAERDEARERRIAARNEDHGNVGIVVDWGRNIIVIGFLFFIAWGCYEVWSVNKQRAKQIYSDEPLHIDD